MAAVNALRGTKLYVKVGDGAGPEVFAHPCLINTRRGIQFRSASNRVIIPDCTNPDDPAWEQVYKTAVSAQISGAGTLDNVIATIQLYDLWFQGDTTKNIQVWLGAIGKWAMAAKLTDWDITGDRGDNIAVSLTIQSHGTITPFAA